jgi:pentatricopeptide repeat protein
MAQARALWNDISPLIVQGNSVYEAYYWTAKAQLDAFDGRIADAERLMGRFNGQTANTELSWIVLQAYRMIFLLELHSNGLMVAMQMLMRNWDTLSSCLLGTQGIETFHATRVYGGLFRNMVFEALDKEDILSLLSAPVGTALTSSSHPESHLRLILLLLTYTVTRLQDIRSITSITLAQSKLYETLIRILEIAEEGGYSMPEQLLTTCSRELSRGGYEDIADEVLGRVSPINHHYSASLSPVVTESDIPKSEEMHQVSAFLMVAARKGDILKAHELFTTLVQSGAAQKRDIRQLLLSYTRAPIYEIGTSPLREYDKISHDQSTDATSHEVELGSTPDRISDAEEIFDRLLAPHRPSVADYSIILYAYARRGNVEKVNAWVERMLEDGILSQDIPWELALRAFAVNGDASAVARVLDHMKQIHKHQHGNLSSSPNFMTVTIFNILMELMARRRDPWNARRLWTTGVVHGGIKPNINSVVKLMRAYAEAGDWRGVVQAWDYLRNEATQQWLRANSRGETNISIYNVVLRAYVAIGAPFNTVLQLFRKMKTDPVLGAEPDSFTYTMMIISASDGGNMSGALRWFKEMEEMERKKGLPESIQVGKETPDTARQSPRRMTIDYRPIYALTYIMAGFLRQQDWERAKWAYEEIKRRGLIPLPLTYALIIKSYTTAAGKDLEETGLEVAEHFLQFITGHGQPLGHSKLKKITHPQTLDTIHAPLLTAYVRKKDRYQVERLFDQISALGGEASIASLTTLMDVYRKLGDGDAVRGTWEKILELAEDVLEDESAMALLADLGGHRDELASVGASRATLCYPLSIYMDAMSASGRHAEIAFEWQRLRESGFAFDAHNWNHLVVVLVRAGEVEKAFDVVENVILSYATTTRRLSTLQNTDPASPMTEDEWKAIIDPPHWGRRRSLMMANSSAEALAEANMLTSRDQSDTSSGAGFVHDIHILHQVRRNWNMWKPHRRVLTILNRVLLHMESGRPVLPIGVGASDDRLNTPLSDVYALLSRILNRYPRTARLAYGISHGGTPDV